MVTVVVARIVLVPGVLDVIVAWHSPVVPTVPQMNGPTKLPKPLGIEKTTVVPDGAFT
jgi:hypothetical protein